MFEIFQQLLEFLVSHEECKTVKVIASVATQTQVEGDIFNIFELNFIKKCCSIYTNSLSMTHNLSPIFSLSPD